MGLRGVFLSCRGAKSGRRQCVGAGGCGKVIGFLVGWFR